MKLRKLCSKITDDWFVIGEPVVTDGSTEERYYWMEENAASDNFIISVKKTAHFYNF